MPFDFRMDKSQKKFNQNYLALDSLESSSREKLKNQMTQHFIFNEKIKSKES